MANDDIILNTRTLAELADGVRSWCPVVPGFGDMRDAAKELIYLLASRRTHAARLESVMHERFYPAFPDLDAIREADRSLIERILRPLGQNRRMARLIVGVVQGFHTRGLRFCDATMRSLDGQGELWTFLETLPGVGPKIIECLRVFAFDYPGVPLDTHNWRVMWRFGVLPSDFMGKKGEPKSGKIRLAQLALRKVVPNGEGRALHNRLMLFGDEHCPRRNPLCMECPLSQSCLRRGLTLE